MQELYSLSDLMSYILSFIPIGFLLGCFPFVVGLAVNGIIKIFKQVA